MDDKQKLKIYKRKYLLTASIFAIIGIIIMPLAVLLFSLNDSLIDSNISVIGSKPEHHLELILLVSSLAIFYHFYILYIYYITENNKFFAKKMINVATPFMILSTIFRYNPEENYWMAQIHVIFSFIAAILYIYCVILLVLHLKYFDPKISGFCFVVISGVAVVAFLIVFKTMIISSLLEIIGVAAVSAILFIISIMVYKSKNFDVIDFYEYHKNNK
ncbi:MAG: hypothetical protein IJV94_02180 [Bacilli bacterium]|nr:hypothetical protein [Bacilli bacterium]